MERSSSPVGDHYARLRGEQIPPATPPVPPATPPVTPAVLPWVKDDDPAVSPEGRWTGPADYRRFQSNARDGGLAAEIKRRYPKVESQSHHEGLCHCVSCTGARREVRVPRPLVTSGRVHHAGQTLEPTYSYTVGSKEDPSSRRASLLPDLPKPDPGTLERLSQPEPPPVKVPTPGSRAAVCVSAGHDVYYRESAQQWHCRTCDARRHRNRRGTEAAPERKAGLLARVWHR